MHPDLPHAQALPDALWARNCWKQGKKKATEDYPLPLCLFRRPCYLGGS